ncbi:nickel-responsive transcriptional regulator NikR [Coraliomargarita akajimensis]|uniref:Putative nickel-responsive regulator n=1 Tax=Coraliomargarita akajimensis (strain DSM 45221 / IAM 15411 / JCM 23193 / KCTC 12865 / 04OKA010-24) TaxID=583355 RepID=D5ELG0_CORAD|nr:nickel-responsive transcriptional regulator NikR [Coraliomargarita akajimensis]ADE55096.1 transcriptional regulator NikR, CopG family [Coraliomargarita akajimensis DSM 45221]
MNPDQKEAKSLAARISVSLPQHLAEALDHMVQERGFHNRSQAIAEMIQQSLITHHQDDDETLMAGTITLIYDSTKRDLLQKLARIEHEHIEEVISSQHVFLEGKYIMEVVLVQGPVKQLRHITNRMVTCKGVSSGGLTLTSKILPQLHGR